jgi:hypothetical protein
MEVLALCGACAGVTEANPHPARDHEGVLLRVNDRVRILGEPPLAGMSPEARSETQPVFKHLVGTYRRISEFDEYGHARLHFRISRGRHRGYHTVWIEPCLLRKWRRRRTRR